MINIVTRRDFLKTAAVFSSIGLAPAFLTRAAEINAPAIEGFKDDRILVVVQLGGGNDGLNTVVPHSNDTYYRMRPQIGLKKDQIIRVNDDLALNARLADLMHLYDDGKVALIQGVGYPNPDRSHFRSMEIWHTASDSDAFCGTGWIGRYFDNACSGSARPQAGVAIGGERPQAFEGEKGFGVAFDDPRRFGWEPGKASDTKENFERLNAPRGSSSQALDFLRHTTSNAIMSSYEVHAAAERAGLKSGGRGTDPLQTVAAMIRGGLATRIYYVATSGFDTHANQVATQDNLLGRFGESVRKFQETLEADGTADRVVTMVFSEFGRRVHENASGGTDHGTAAPMFLIGPHVKAGIHGAMPDLDDLDDGDLKYGIDFRSVYAGVLNDWFTVDAEPILTRRFDSLPLIA